MGSDCDDFIAKRIDKAKTECEDYLKLEYSEMSSSDDLRDMAETLIYKKAFMDGMALGIKYSQNV